MSGNGISFLNYLYKDLFRSEEVMHGIEPKFIGNKESNIRRYIERMQLLHERVLKGNYEIHLNILKSFYYKKYVIKEEQIPESYFAHQKQIYLERGYGHIEFDSYERHQLALQIINDQMRSLDKWIEYFVSDYSASISMWAKYWAFQGMLTMGVYDKENNVFTKRSKGTIAPFIDLNREALALSIDFLISFLDENKINDEHLEKLLKSGNFNKIYTYVLNKLINDKKSIRDSIAGKWVKYKQGSDPMFLVQALQGYNTGWCTAGFETAKYQLENGDFHVYYTYDENGEAKIPRIAIRMEDSNIAEVRGIAYEQNIEPELEEVVSAKLKEFPDRDKYNKKVSDMHQLTKIYNKTDKGERLTKEEIAFLYEIDEKIDGFGFESDPRIQELLAQRNNAFDLNILFEGLQEYEGNLEFKNLKNLVGLKFPPKFEGNITMIGLTCAKGITFPKVLIGDLNLMDLVEATELQFPEKIYGNLYLNNLKQAPGLIFPESLNGSLILRSLIDAKKITFPKKIYGELYLSSILDLEGVNLPDVVYGDIYFDSLKNIQGLKLPLTMGGDIYFNELDYCDSLTLPTDFNGFIIFKDNVIISANKVKMFD